MRRTETKTDVRLTRFAWMAALVVVLRVVAWDLHHVADAHDAETEHTCEICLVFERGGDGGSAVTGPGLAPAFSAPPIRATSTPGHSAPAPCPPPRGPPALQS